LPRENAPPSGHITVQSASSHGSHAHADTATHGNGRASAVFQYRERERDRPSSQREIEREREREKGIGKRAKVSQGRTLLIYSSEKHTRAHLCTGSRLAAASPRPSSAFTIRVRFFGGRKFA
jgi:hypothetical protein